jgi:hypothetical protein
MPLSVGSADGQHTPLSPAATQANPDGQPSAAGSQVSEQ